MKKLPPKPALPVSVIIPTFNREDVLCDTIESVLKQEYPRLELIIVDQTVGHKPKTSAFLSRLEAAGKITLIRLPFPSTPAARNAGAGRAKNEIIIFIDDDVSLLPGFIAAHAANYAGANYAGTGVSAVAGRVIASPPEPDPDSWRCKNPVKDWWWFKWDAPVRGPAASALGCNMSLRKSALMAAGGFDENFINECWGEETDVCFRLRKAGFTLVYDPRAALIHLKTPAGGSRSAGRDQTLNASLYRNMAYFFFKNLRLRDLPRHLAYSYRCNVCRGKGRILKSRAAFALFARRNAAFVCGLLRASGAISKKKPAKTTP